MGQRWAAFPLSVQQKCTVCHPQRGNAEQMCMCVKKQPSQLSQAHMSLIELHVHVCMPIYTALLKLGVSSVTPPSPAG